MFIRRTVGQRALLLAIIIILTLALTACNLASGTGDGGQNTVTGVPVVQIAAPPPNATFLENVAVNIQALVSNAGTDIDRVEILVDGTNIQTLKSPNAAGASSFSLSQAWHSAGAGQHTISVIAFRADGSSSVPATVTVSVVSNQPLPSATAAMQGGGQPAQPTPNNGGSNNDGQPAQATPVQEQPTAPPAEPTAVPASATPSKPTATLNQGVNVRSGPSTLFNPPIGSFAAGQTADIVAKTPAGDWYKVRYYNGEGWVFGQLLTVSGDVNAIPVDAGPPIPTLTPVVPTAIPATPVPPTAVSQADLVLGNVVISPDVPLKCNRTVEFKIDVANLGTTATTAGGTISIRDIAAAGETTTNGVFPVLNPGQTQNIGGIFLTVSINVGENHRLVVSLNPNGAVPETNPNNNSREWNYTLAGC
jgi:predicted small secreted protein